MEWNSKTCTWNGVTKLEIQDNNFQSRLASLAGSNGSGPTNMFSVDLKLGRLEDMGDVSLKNSMPFNTASSSSASPVLAVSKRGRPRYSGAAQSNVFCSVDGCSSDLNLCREYHRRHKVCERHSKTPFVLIGGKAQRFCQQCSRFQSLEEFDEAKRSCRKRLDGHNRRRRKKQPETCYMPESAGGFLSSHTGDRMLQFCCPQMNIGNWATMTPSDMCFRNNQEAIYHPLMTVAPIESSRGGLKDFPPRDSGCALSLLSRYPSQSPGICVRPPAMQPTTMSLSSAQGSSTDLNLNNTLVQVSYSQGLEYMESSSSLSSSTNAKAQSFGGFRSSDDGFRETGLSSKIFPFCWSRLFLDDCESLSYC